MWYKRILKDKIEAAANYFPAIVLTGARQTGKTTLLTKLFPNHAYVSLDIPSIAALAENEPQSFLSRYKPPLIVDEVQYAPKLFRHLKIVIDKNRHETGQFILTGSQKFSLMKEVSESLSGRAAIFELETLALTEVRGGDLAPMTVTEYVEKIVRGGFPELWRVRDFPKETFFSSYLSTYLERDIRQILNVSSLRDFERFIRACAARHGQLLDKSGLANDVGVSVKAINSWLSVLEASNQIVLLEPWFSNFGKRLIKTPKLYFCDSGFLCFLLGITLQNFLSSPFLGVIWEGFCFAELRKMKSAAQNPKTIWFYRDKQQVEVDFLVLGGGEGALVECKWAELPIVSDTRNMIKVMQTAKERKVPDLMSSSAYILCRTEELYPIVDSVKAINLDNIGICFP